MANRGRDHTAVPTTTTEYNHTTSLKQRIEETKWLLHPLAGKSSCCTFKVPHCLAKTNKGKYRPHIISIGPYHYGDKHVVMMQQHKWRFLHDLLGRTQSIGLDDYQQVVAEVEDDIRECYAETITLCSRDLVEMMVLDGLFIIEIFCKVKLLSPSDPDDPIFNLAWVFTCLLRDLLLLENQVPFFVLQKLFDISKPSRKESNSSLAQLALEFFNCAVGRPPEVLKHYFSVEGKHLLDLLRLSFVPEPQDDSPQENVEFIQSAKKLHDLAGIKFKTREAKSFLDIRFCNGVLEIPHIKLDDLHTHIFMNFVAFEQCYSHCSKYITTYAAFMSCLVRTPMDATFLSHKNIIENYLGTDKEVVHFFKNLGKDVPFDIDSIYLKKLFNDVNEYQRNILHVQWAGFRFRYFDSPWSFLSALAAFILLILTTIQAFFSVYAYLCPPSSGGRR